MAAVTYYDLFPAGLGLDLAGATLLARGLFTSPDEFARRMAVGRNTFNRFSVRAAEDRADIVGVGVLIGGFLAQGVGYVLYIGGAQNAAHGSSARVVAVAFLLGGFLCGFVVPHCRRARRIRRFL